MQVKTEKISEYQQFVLEKFQECDDNKHDWNTKTDGGGEGVFDKPSYPRRSHVYLPL